MFRRSFSRQASRPSAARGLRNSPQELEAVPRGRTLSRRIAKPLLLLRTAYHLAHTPSSESRRETRILAGCALRRALRHAALTQVGVCVVQQKPSHKKKQKKPKNGADEGEDAVDTTSIITYEPHQGQRARGWIHSFANYSSNIVQAIRGVRHLPLLWLTLAQADRPLRLVLRELQQMPHCERMLLATFCVVAKHRLFFALAEVHRSALPTDFLLKGTKQTVNPTAAEHGNFASSSYPFKKKKAKKTSTKKKTTITAMQTEAEKMRDHLIHEDGPRHIDTRTGFKDIMAYFVLFFFSFNFGKAVAV